MNGLGTRTGLGTRADALGRLASGSFDLLVVGGGITGAGIALDAATRGLSVALVEARDFASGTSSRSSKLVHGGLRYLEQGEIGLVRQSARERELLRRLAPHLVRPLPFVLPKGTWAEALLTRTGLAAYDLLAGIGASDRHRSVSRLEAAELAGGLVARAGAFVYHDCGTDDSRLVIEVLRAACRAGAVVCNHAEATGLLAGSSGRPGSPGSASSGPMGLQGPRGARVAGCEVRDLIGGAMLEVRAADVVNAAGVWADGVRRLEDAGASAALRPSKGIHLVLPRAVLPLQAACLVPYAGQKGRRIFAVPWRSSVIVGPTDTDYAGPLAAPSVEVAEVAGLLEALSQAFERSFTPDDLVGAFAGLRPLIGQIGHAAVPGGAAGEPGEAGRPAPTTRDLSRRHLLATGPTGMVTITGGKLTTYRHMGEEAVDLVVERRGSSPERLPSVTTRTPLLEGDLGGLTRAVAERAGALGLAPDVAPSLVLSYGDRAPEVLALAEAEDLLAPLVPGLPYLEAEIVWGAREEMGATAEDLLARRTRVSLEDPCGGLGNPRRLTGLLASALGIPEQEAGEQVGAYRKALAHERGPSVPVRQ